jgi:hypothetical protein
MPFFLLGLSCSVGIGSQKDFGAMALRDDVACMLCAQDPETIDHLLAQCVFAREVWFKVFRRCGWQNLVLEPRMFAWRGTWPFDSLVVLVAWCIWLQHNARVFNQTAATPVGVVDNVWLLAELWCRARLITRSLLLGM